MSDYAEWGEGTAGVLAAQGNPGEEFDWDEYREQTWQRNQREAVVCLVDCSENMFGLQQDTTPFTATAERSAVKTEPAAATAAATAHVHGSTASAAPSFFSMTMQSILALLREKVVKAGKDVLAIVLYNTRLASAGFGGVYVIQEATHIGTECMQKVEQLAAAGTRGTAAYAEFEERIGHGPTPSAGAPLATARFKFSEALWEAQRILLSICGSQAIRHRRLFVFTSHDNPSAGDRREWLQCCSRASDLGKEGVVLEVFGFGTDVTSQTTGDLHRSTAAVATTGGSGRSGATDTAATPSSVTGTGSSSGPTMRSLFAVSSTLGPSHEPGSYTSVISSAGASATSAESAAALTAVAACGFAEESFWGPLLRTMQEAAAQSGLGGAGAGLESAVAATESREEAFVRGGAGAVYVSAGAGTLQQLLSSVVRHAHPQRPFRHCLLRIGGASRGSADSSDAVLRTAVSLYTPLMRARPPQREWLDARTNRMLRRVVRLYAQATGSEGGAEVDGQGNEHAKSSVSLRREDGQRSEAAASAHAAASAETEVQAGELCDYAAVGKERVYFTKEERRRLVEVAAAGAETGFTVLLFKDVDAALKREHVVRRSSFLHACVQRGGPKSHQLFVLFVRRLRAAGKAAIAQFRSSAAAAPRLVALVPSPDLAVHPELLDKLPVEGLGLYVVPLPYAEELRAVPLLETCTLADRHAVPVLPDRAVDPAHRELATQLVQALTVPYRIDAVLNPVLQRQYRQLQELARRLYPLADNPLSLAASSAAAAEAVGDGGGDDAAESLDETRPDYASMQHYAALFHRFNTEVLGTDYDAAVYCPQPRPIGAGAARRGCAEASCGAAAGEFAADGEAMPIAQVIRDAAVRNAWGGVTIPQLKEYLAEVKVSAGAARRKADLLQLVQRHLPPAA